ncbi:MAG: divergent polysaccharide deacetylase family protein [Alphaproteobacteria bacterium]|nr:divergent polysaccharide deacetylase family protein [Alphaproteobacteria bacterium]
MIRSVFKELFGFTKHLVVLAVFLVLTFFILEYLKAYQKGEEFSFQKVIIEFSEPSQVSVPEKLSDEEVFFNEAHDLLSEVKDVPVEQEVVDAKDEVEYELYEEELPHDIILDVLHAEEKPQEKPVVVEKVVKDIKPEPVKKQPIHFAKEPVIAIVIDDMGISKKRTKDINLLHFPITSSFLTYGTDLDGQVASSMAAGHEVIAHIPMEAKSNVDAAPDVLKTSMSNEEINKAFKTMLDKFKNIKGINNHMGSKFTENESKLDEVMKILKERNLFFLDSRTSSKSVAGKVAKAYGVRYVNRNIFLDNINEYEYIKGQLEATERVARKRGYAIAIGHPKSQTYQVLNDWLPTAGKKGFRLVHLSEVVDVLNK